MTREQLESEFVPRGVLRGGILMLPPDEAIALVRRARAAQINVLAMDAFRITERSTQPFMEHSTDYTASSVPAPADPWTEAEEFLSRYRETGFVFEVVLGSRGSAPS